MHILMTGDAVGGVWQYGLDLALGCTALGHQVTFAILGPPPTLSQMRQAQAIPGCRVVPMDLPLDWTAADPPAVLEAGAALARFAETLDPDIIHLHTPTLAVGGRFAGPTAAVCHSCVATWWHAVGSGPLSDDLVWRSRLVTQGCRSVDALLAPTNAFAIETARVHDVPMPLVVRNGRRRSGVDARPGPWTPFVFTAGRLWDRAKNMEAVFRLAALLPVPVVAAGAVEGLHGERVTASAVRLLGQVDSETIADHLSRRPIYLSLARYEPFGLAVLEAAQAGCPLVLSDIATFRELWDDAAVFVDPEDEAAAAAAVDLLLGDADERARLGLAARARAAGYSAEAMTDGVLDVFHALLADKSRADRGSMRAVRAS